MRSHNFALWLLGHVLGISKSHGQQPQRKLADGGVLSESDQEQLLEIHNKYRSATALGNAGSQPMATDMLELVWDEGLAAASKAHAEVCVWAHGTNLDVGENLYTSASTNDSVDNIDTLVAGVTGWYEEHVDYSYEGLSCQPNQMCGHYTQVVWASTRAVGCGYAECGAFDSATYPYQVLLVCRYDPPGNYVGMRPYRSAASLASVASDCPDGYRADASSGLCKIQDDNDNDNDTPTTLSPVSPTTPTTTTTTSPMMPTAPSIPTNSPITTPTTTTTTSPTVASGGDNGDNGSFLDALCERLPFCMLCQLRSSGTRTRTRDTREKQRGWKRDRDRGAIRKPFPSQSNDPRDPRPSRTRDQPRIRRHAIQ